MRIARVRVISQVFFFALFAFLSIVASTGRMRGYPVALFLQLDPLIAVATALSSHVVYHGLLLSLVVIIGTFLIGRFFCGWVCPFGALNQFVGWLFNMRPNKERIAVNRYRTMFALKYYILAFLLVLAAFGSLQIGWLDPICLLHRF